MKVSLGPTEQSGCSQLVAFSLGAVEKSKIKVLIPPYKELPLPDTVH